jgi:hypothetical protein
MFGFKLIKKKEFENLKEELRKAKTISDAQAIYIAQLESMIKEMEVKQSELNVKVEPSEEKPVKKVRRKSTNKTIKKEE